MSWFSPLTQVRISDCAHSNLHTNLKSGPATFQIGGKKFTPVPDGRLVNVPGGSFGTNGYWISTTDRQATGSVCNL